MKANPRACLLSQLMQRNGKRATVQHARFLRPTTVQRNANLCVCVRVHAKGKTVSVLFVLLIRKGEWCQARAVYLSSTNTTRLTSIDTHSSAAAAAVCCCCSFGPAESVLCAAKPATSAFCS